MRGRRSEHDEERELGWFDLPIARDISRDGRTLLFEEQGIYGGALYAVCLRGTDGSAPVRLGAGSACALSPDGKRALAIHYGPPQRLLLLPTGAGDSTSLHRGPIDRYYAASWMPDGKSVVFAGSEPGHAQRSYLQDLRGGRARPITAEGIAGARVSPDGRLIAAVSGDQRLFICPLGGDSARFVAQLLPMESVLQWTADGRALYVGSFEIPISAARIELATGRRTPWRTLNLPDPAGVSAGGMVLTPDGQGYAYWYIRELSDLYLVDGLK
jgi:dipeptidyl aminopeptidase/acylaminoacyl peptidase